MGVQTQDTNVALEKKSSIGYIKSSAKECLAGKIYRPTHDHMRDTTSKYLRQTFSNVLESLCTQLFTKALGKFKILRGCDKNFTSKEIDFERETGVLRRLDRELSTLLREVDSALDAHTYTRSKY